MKKYHIRIMEHTVDIPDGVPTDYDDYETAYNTISGIVHEYDGCPFTVVGCVDDNEYDETIDYVNSFRS